MRSWESCPSAHGSSVDRRGERVVDRLLAERDEAALDRGTSCAGALELPEARRMVLQPKNGHQATAALVSNALRPDRPQRQEAPALAQARCAHAEGGPGGLVCFGGRVLEGQSRN